MTVTNNHNENRAGTLVYLVLAAASSVVGFVLLRSDWAGLILWQAACVHLAIIAVLNRAPRPSLSEILSSLGRVAWPAHASLATLLALAFGAAASGLRPALAALSATLSFSIWVVAVLALFRASRD